VGPSGKSPSGPNIQATFPQAAFGQSHRFGDVIVRFFSIDSCSPSKRFVTAVSTLGPEINMKTEFAVCYRAAKNFDNVLRVTTQDTEDILYPVGTFSLLQQSAVCS